MITTSDIFVSYAHGDDTKLLADEAGGGWVTGFVAALRNLLARRLGRRDPLSIWWDRSALKGGDIIPDEIIASIRSTSAMVVILSPSYISSPWCMAELDCFVSQFSESLDGRIFVLQVDPDLDEAQIPAVIRDIYRYPAFKRSGSVVEKIGFPQPKDDDIDFAVFVDDVCRDISLALKEGAVSGAGFMSAPENRFDLFSEDDNAVFVSDYGFSGLELRQRLLRALHQADIPSIPKNAQSSLEGVELEAALKGVKLFIQCLSEDVLQEPLALDLARKQSQAARLMGLQCLTWRPPGLSSKLTNASSSTGLFFGEHVYSGLFTDFVRRVVDTARSTSISIEPADNQSSQPFIFLCSDHGSDDLAHSVSQRLSAHNFAVSSALKDGTAREIREDIEENLAACDAMLLIPNTEKRTSNGWVRQQLIQAWKVRRKRESDYREILVHSGPEQGTIDFGIRLPRLRPIDASSNEILSVFGGA